MINELSAANFMQSLGFDEHVKLDLDKLVLSTQCYGGGGAIKTAIHDARVKCLVLLDASLYSFEHEMDDLEFQGTQVVGKPVLVAYTGLYHKLNTYLPPRIKHETLYKKFKEKMAPVTKYEEVILHGVDHIMSLDPWLVMGFEIQAGQMRK